MLNTSNNLNKQEMRAYQIILDIHDDGMDITIPEVTARYTKEEKVTRQYVDKILRSLQFKGYIQIVPNHIEIMELAS